MSWLKQSDIAADHPLVMRLLEYPGYDDRLLNEMYGWVNRCATKSAAHDMDYIVAIGTARSLAFGRYEELKAAALFCGIFFERVIDEEILDDKGIVVGVQPRNVLKLVEEKDLFHMILRSEKEWEAQRQYDNRNPERSGPVRLRDGDECRWCGRITRWDADRKSGRMGTIDHLKPGLKDSSDEDRVVACKSCNTSRQEGENWNKKLRPVPSNPYYGAETAKWLFEKCGFRVEATDHRTETRTPVEHPADQKQKAVEPPHVVEDPAQVSATDTSGATNAPDLATEPATAAPSPEATVTPAQVERSHSDLLAYPPAEALDEETPAVEPPAQVEDLADDQTSDPERGQATDTSGRPSARLNQDADQERVNERSNTDQTPIKDGSKNDQWKTRDASYGRSGYAGSGRDGTGRAGSGGVGHAGAGHSALPKSSDPSKPRRRRNRPRRRNNS